MHAVGPDLNMQTGCHQEWPSVSQPPVNGSVLKHIARLQRAQHALARVVLQERSRARSAPLMLQLHWLPIDWRIRFKLATLTYKALQTGRHILQTLYTFTQLQSPHVHLPLSYFSFHVITFHLVHGLSVFLPPKFGIPSLFTSGNHNHSPHSDVI